MHIELQWLGNGIFNSSLKINDLSRGYVDNNFTYEIQFSKLSIPYNVKYVDLLLEDNGYGIFYCSICYAWVVLFYQWDVKDLFLLNLLFLILTYIVSLKKILCNMLLWHLEGFCLSLW